MKTLKIVLISCPQPMLIGEKTGSIYSPNRSLTPEPTLPQLEGILQKCSERFNVPIEVIQLDLRDPSNGKIRTFTYGELSLPYLEEKLLKSITTVSLKKHLHSLTEADAIGFTNNFAMSRRVVCDNIKEVRRMFPKKEIWIGGRDVFTNRVKSVYANAAGRDNCIIFDGHAYESLPKYLEWKILGKGKLSGITVYVGGHFKEYSPESLNNFSNEDGAICIPLPIYRNPKSLAYFTGSGEGQPRSSFRRFVHMTISIGCPHSCGYCTSGYREKFLIFKDLKNIQEELELYKKMEVTTIAIMDDNLLAIPRHKLIKIMDLINSYDFMIEYGNGLQLSRLIDNWDNLANPIFKKCVSLYAPLEDLTKDCMYEKLAPINRELELMKRIKESNFINLKYLTMGIILGVPGHTRKKLEDFFIPNIQRFLEVFSGSSLEIAATIFNYMPLPGTVFGERALDSGRMIVKDPFYKDPEVCSFGTTSYAPEGMTHQEVFSFYERGLNLNPAGKELGLSYIQLQRLGEKSLPIEDRWKIPSHWKVPGYHLRTKMP